MFLAAAPYFQSRLHEDPWALQNFQPAIISVSTVTNLSAMLFLTSKQKTASYPFRINLALYVNVVVFALLTLSTTTFLDATPGQYLAFLLIMVAAAAWAAGLVQNGAFAFASSFGRPEYLQGIMAGQGVAGVLPSLAQIVTVLVSPPEAGEAGKPAPDAPGAPKNDGGAAFLYFIAAVIMSVIAILAAVPLVRRHNHIVENRALEHMATSINSIEEAERAGRKTVSMITLLRQLHWLAGAAFVCFVVTMFFPVFTTKILSVAPPQETVGSPLLRPAAFIPLGFFFWNLGDLSGRASALRLSVTGRPALLFALSLARVVFLPLYMLCNLNGHGAVVSSDLFYLLLVQLPFGLTNGWLASNCMMAAGEWVDESEREAAGGFMGLCIIAGLSVGSLLSFTAAGI